MAVLVRQSAPRSAILPGQCFLSAFRAFGHGVFHPPFIRLNTKWKYNKHILIAFLSKDASLTKDPSFPLQTRRNIVMSKTVSFLCWCLLGCVQCFLQSKRIQIDGNGYTGVTVVISSQLTPSEIQIQKLKVSAL